MNYIAIHNTESDLKHYGVLGMKWGVRKARNKAYKKERKRLYSKYTSATKSLDKKISNAKRAKKMKPHLAYKYDAIKNKALYNYHRDLVAKMGKKDYNKYAEMAQKQKTKVLVTNLLVGPIGLIPMTAAAVANPSSMPALNARDVRSAKNRR